MAKNEDEITRDLQDKTDVLNTYKKHLNDLVKIHDQHPTEVSRLISATQRGIRRLEKQQKTLNKELDHVRGDEPGYVHDENPRRLRSV